MSKGNWGGYFTGCAGKQPYPSRREANGVLLRMRSRRCAANGLHPYKCPHCSNYHLGRQADAAQRITG
jgi:hypothetical protein